MRNSAKPIIHLPTLSNRDDAVCEMPPSAAMNAAQSIESAADGFSLSILNCEVPLRTDVAAPQKKRGDGARQWR